MLSGMNELGEEMLEDSLSYSPLKEITNKENSPAYFLTSMEKVRHSPSTARLFALFGGTSKSDFSPGGLKPKRLEDLLGTPRVDQSPILVPSRPSLVDVTSELNTLRSSLQVIQKDCEFHRTRAVAAQDEVDKLNGYITQLELERKQLLAKPLCCPPTGTTPQIEELLVTIASLETLNKSLSRQNDALRRRPSLSNRFTLKEACCQTIIIETTEQGTDAVTNELFHPMSPMKIPQYTPPSYSSSVAVVRHHEASSQTETGIWATVEDLSQPPARVSSTLIESTKPYIHMPDAAMYRNTVLNDSQYERDIALPDRRSLPSRIPSNRVIHATQCLFKGISTTGGGSSRRSRDTVPQPLHAPVVRCRRFDHDDLSPSSYVSVPRTRRRGQSTGSVKQRRWIP
jgi:hypothetical protein